MSTPLSNKSSGRRDNASSLIECLLPGFKSKKNFYNLLRRTQRFVNNPPLMFSSFFLLLMTKLHKTFMFHSLLNNSFGINSLYDISVTLSDGRILGDGEYMTKSVHELCHEGSMNSRFDSCQKSHWNSQLINSCNKISLKQKIPLDSPQKHSQFDTLSERAVT